MSSALLVRFRPAGPWRLGPDNGVRTQVGTVLHSDSLYSAITIAMRDCGWLEDWIAATAASRHPAVRVSSGYPFTGSTLLVVPPLTVWPPPQGGKLRWKTARFVPLTLVPRLLAGEELSEEQWAVDPVSECLLPVFRNSVATAPFRIVERALAPVDRLTGSTEGVDRVACLHFAQGAGIWFIAEFTEEEARAVWAGRMRSAARLLADSGIGGGRSRGWGRSREPQFGNVDLPEFLTGIAASAEGETAWWTVSLFSPSEDDALEWDRGTYRFVVRAGRTENGELKPASRMVGEGSVLVSGSPPVGTARNVAPAELSHPVYRSGIALAVRIPYQQRQRWELIEHAAAVPEPADEARVTGADETPVEDAAVTALVVASTQEIVLAGAPGTPEGAGPALQPMPSGQPERVREAEADESAEPPLSEIPVGVDLPAVELPAEEPEPADAAVFTDVPPGEDASATGIEPAAGEPESAGVPTGEAAGPAAATPPPEEAEFAEETTPGDRPETAGMPPGDNDEKEEQP